VRPLRSPGAILCFHGVTSPTPALAPASRAAPSQSEVHVPAAAFRALIAAARQMGQLVPLRDLVHRHVTGRSTAGLIAVTADDAYASLLGDIADYVAREAIPFTVFAVMDGAAVGAPFWWDRVDDLFPLVSRERWRAFEDGCGLADDFRRGQPARFGPLRPLRQWVLAAHRGRWPAALEQQLQALEADAGVRTTQRSMTFDELTRFAAIPSVDVGVHTISHPVLPLLPDRDLNREIALGYQLLHERFANAVPILAVPFGLFDERTVSAARESGMTASLTLGGTTLNQGLSRDSLPRFCIARNDTPIKLRLRLTGLLDGGRWWRGRSAPRYPALPSATT
jgi:peptidoglycan/xylan/chitin deacetylase (PgdA/CDA1 family)